MFGAALPDDRRLAATGSLLDELLERDRALRALTLPSGHVDLEKLSAQKEEEHRQRAFERRVARVIRDDGGGGGDDYSDDAPDAPEMVGAPSDSGSDSEEPSAKKPATKKKKVTFVDGGGEKKATAPSKASAPAPTPATPAEVLEFLMRFAKPVEEEKIVWPEMPTTSSQVSVEETERFFDALAEKHAKHPLPDYSMPAAWFDDETNLSGAYMHHPKTGLLVPFGEVMQEEREEEERQLQKEADEIAASRTVRGRRRGKPVGVEYTDEEQRKRHKPVTEPKWPGRKPKDDDDESSKETERERRRRLHLAASDDCGYYDPLPGDRYVPAPLSRRAAKPVAAAPAAAAAEARLARAFLISDRPVPGGVTAAAAGGETVHPHALLKTRTPVSYCQWHQQFSARYAAHLRPLDELRAKVREHVRRELAKPESRAPPFSDDRDTEFLPKMCPHQRTLLLLDAPMSRQDSDETIYERDPFRGNIIGASGPASSAYVPPGVFYPTHRHTLLPDRCIQQSLESLRRHGQYLRMATTMPGDRGTGADAAAPRFVHGSFEDLAEWYTHEEFYEQLCDPIHGASVSLLAKKTLPALDHFAHKLWFPPLGDDEQAWMGDEVAVSFVHSLIWRVCTMRLPSVLDAAEKFSPRMFWKRPDALPPGVTREELGTFAELQLEQLAVHAAEQVYEYLKEQQQQQLVEIPIYHPDRTPRGEVELRKRIWSFIASYLATRYYRLRRFRALVASFGEYLFNAGLCNVVYRPLQAPPDILRRAFDIHVELRAVVELRRRTTGSPQEHLYQLCYRPRAFRSRSVSHKDSPQAEATVPNRAFCKRLLRFVWMSAPPKLRLIPEHPSQRLQFELARQLGATEADLEDSNSVREAFQRLYQHLPEYLQSPPELTAGHAERSVRVLFALTYLRALDSLMVTRRPLTADGQERSRGTERVFDWLPECLVHDARFECRMPEPQVRWTSVKAQQPSEKLFSDDLYSTKNGGAKLDKARVWSFLALPPAAYRELYQKTAERAFIDDNPFSLMSWRPHRALVERLRKDETRTDSKRKRDVK